MSAEVASGVVVDLFDVESLPHPNGPKSYRLLLKEETARELYRELRAWYRGE